MAAERRRLLYRDLRFTNCSRTSSERAKAVLSALGSPEDVLLRKLSNFAIKLELPADAGAPGRAPRTSSEIKGHGIR